MEDYIAKLFAKKLAGIQLLAWQQFLSIFTESVSEAEIDRVLERIAKNIVLSVSDPEAADQLADKFREIATLNWEFSAFRIGLAITCVWMILACNQI